MKLSDYEGIKARNACVPLLQLSRDFIHDRLVWSDERGKGREITSELGHKRGNVEFLVKGFLIGPIPNLSWICMKERENEL